MRIVLEPLAFPFGAIFLLISLSGCNVMHSGMNNQMGMSLYKQGNYTAARGEFQRAVANDPWNADYLHNLAAAQKRQGDIAAAEQTYRKALNVDPAHQPSYHGLAMLMKENGRTTEAVEMMQGWVEQQPYLAEPYIESAWLKRETGDIAGSEQLLLQALRIKPNDHVATAQLGQLYQDTNQPDRAVAMYRRSLYTNWYQPQVQSRMAQLQRPQGYGYGPPMPAYASQPGVPVYQNAYAVPQNGVPMYAPVITRAPAAGPPVVIGQPIQLGVPTTVNADPAHVPGAVGAGVPVVQPY